MKLIYLNEAINAVNQEPELPGEMPAEMKQTLQKALNEKDVDLLAEAMRIAVRATKKGILERLQKVQVYSVP
jgi:hypothetical protein